MTSEMGFTADDARHVYYQGNYLPGRIIAMIAALIMVGTGIWFPARMIQIANSYSEGWRYMQPFLWILVVVPLVTLGGAALIWYWIQIRLATSPQGIEYLAGLFHLSAPWSAVERIDQVRHWNGLPMEVLRLREPATVGGLCWLASERLRWNIPLFMVTMRPPEFTADLKQYAPELYARPKT